MLLDAAAQKQVLVYLVVLVSAIVVLVHLPSLSAQALFHDDADYVIRNSLVQNPSWHAAARFFREVWEPSTVRGYYQPLTMLSLMVDRSLSGPHESLYVYHRTSLALHAANTVLMAILLYSLFGQPIVAAGIALLFGLHPLAVESVCWISERKTVLASFFALWSLLAYVRFAHEPKARSYIMCVLMYLLALLSKPITVPLPLVMLLLDCWPLNRLNRKAILEKMPLLAVGIVFAAITYISQSRTTSVYFLGNRNLLHIPLVLCHNIVFYLAKALWPVNLSAHYGYATMRAMLVGVLGTGVFLSLLIVSLRWTRALLVGWLIFFVMALPTMGIISVTPVTAANRYLYLPSIGLILAVGGLLSYAAGLQKLHSSRGMFVALAAGFLVIAVGEIRATQAYRVQWKNSINLYQYMLSVTPHSAILHRDLGTALSHAGRANEALDHYRHALRIEPHDVLAHFNLAVELAKSEESIDEAIEHYEKAVMIDPAYFKAHLNLAGTLFAKGKVSEAVTHYEKAVQLNPDFVLAHYNLGKVLPLVDRPMDGLQHLREAVRIDESFVLALKDLAWLLATHPAAEVRNADEAIRFAERAREITAERDMGVLDVLATAYALGGQYEKAVETAERALAIAERVQDGESANRIAERIHLFQLKCPYYEDPKVQLERLAAERAKKGRSRTEDVSTDSHEREMGVKDFSQEVQDGIEAIIVQ